MGSRSGKILVCLFSLVFLLTLSLPTSVMAKTKLLFVGAPGGIAGEWMDENVKLYQELHPDIEMELVRGSTYSDPQKLMTMIAGGTPPDLTWLEVSTVADWGARGTMTVLDDYMKKYGWSEEDFVPQRLRVMMWQGHIYGVPVFMSTFGSLWNKDLFSEAGLDPTKGPKHWEDQIEYAKKLTKYDDKGKMSQLGVYLASGTQHITLLLGNVNTIDAPFFSEDFKKSYMDDPKWIKAYKYMMDIHNAMGGMDQIHEFETSVEVFKGFDLFMMGKVGMYNQTGLYRMSAFARYTPDIKVDVGVFPYAKDGHPVAYAGGWNFAIPKGAKHPDEAFEFFNYVISPETKRMARFTELHGNLPTQVKNLEYNIEHVIPEMNFPDVRMKFAKLTEWMINYMPPNPFGATVRGHLSRILDDVRWGKLTVEEGLKKANTEIQKDIDRYWARRK